MLYIQVVLALVQVSPIKPVQSLCRFPEPLFGSEEPWEIQSEDGTPNLKRLKQYPPPTQRR